ncbi:MAG TPA: agmatine deiminase family protein [Gammaproteobacteria bacterium]|nr:agmatine deiminase family protein [Gammaproteobacteria bacterium]
MATGADASVARRLPAEWEPQSGVLLTWPRSDGPWASMLAPVERVFTHLACEISQRERVLIVAADAAHQAHVRGLIATAGGVLRRVTIAVAPSNDIWARDHGPITVETAAGPLLLDFTFNGWGNKFPAERDNRITGELAAAGCFGQTPVETAAMVLEGGSIDTDGAGTLLTTSHCLLQASRNPELDRAGIEARLRALLGIERVLWLDHGALAGDDTDSHIDTLARFADSGTILYQDCADPQDENLSDIKRMESELEALVDADQAPYRLVPLPSPKPIHNARGQRLPASYANFLVINGAVLVPAYDDPADETARELIAGCFPGRDTIAIDCLPLIHQFGSLHCVTMQLPEGVLGTDE